MNERLYILKAENLKTKEVFDHVFTPMIHKEACTILSKMPNLDWRRDYVEEVVTKP